MGRKIIAKLIFMCSTIFHLPVLAEEESEAKYVQIDLTKADPVIDDLQPYRWNNRIILVFAESAENPLFLEQNDLFLSLPEELIERDIIVFTDTDPSADTKLRQQLRPRGFTIVIIGKDGKVKLRKPFPWSVREISRAIDNMPMRQLEIQSKSK